MRSFTWASSTLPRTGLSRDLKDACIKGGKPHPFRQPSPRTWSHLPLPQFPPVRNARAGIQQQRAGIPSFGVTARVGHCCLQPSRMSWAYASLWNPVHFPSVRCSLRQERTSKNQTADCGEATESIVIPMLVSPPTSRSVYPWYRSHVRMHATWHRKRNAKVSPQSFRTETAGVHCSWHNSVIGKRIAVLGPCRTNTISSAQKTFATTTAGETKFWVLRQLRELKHHALPGVSCSVLAFG